MTVEFDGVGSCNRFFFAVFYNSSSSHDDNRKYKILVFGEGETGDVIGSVGTAKKKFTINFGKARGLSFITVVIIVICLLTGKKYISWKPIKIYQLPTQFCLGNVPDISDAIEVKEVSFKGNVYDFSVDCNAIDKSDILNIHTYLMVKDYIK